MNADLERLIALQKLDSAADAARKQLAAEPEHELALKAAEAQMVAEQKAVDADRKTGSAKSVELKGSLERIAAERATLVAGLDKGVLSTFEMVARKRNGIAVAEARSGICTICHVRLRP